MKTVIQTKGGEEEGVGVHNYNSHSDRTGEEGGEVIVIQKEDRGFLD